MLLLVKVAKCIVVYLSRWKFQQRLVSGVRTLPDDSQMGTSTHKNLDLLTFRCVSMRTWKVPLRIKTSQLVGGEFPPRRIHYLVAADVAFRVLEGYYT